MQVILHPGVERTNTFRFSQRCILLSIFRQFSFSSPRSRNIECLEKNKVLLPARAFSLPLSFLDHRSTQQRPRRIFVRVAVYTRRWMHGADAHNVAAKACFPGVERSSRDGSTTSDMDAYLRTNRGAGHPSTYPREGGTRIGIKCR